MLGYSSEELTGLCYLDIVHKDDREECERQSRAELSPNFGDGLTDQAAA
jgi:hypothetical protein